jgi:hypothetical protein
MGVWTAEQFDGDCSRQTSVDLLPVDGRRRKTLLWLFIATVICLAIGISAFWPYLLEEHRRLRPWQWIPLWLGDLTALFWFISAIVSPPTDPRSFGDAGWTAEDRRHRRRKFLVTMGCAIAIDFSHTAYALWREAIDFARAQVVTGEVVANQIWQGTDCTRYYVQVRFRDRNNLVHEEEIRVEGVHIGGLPANQQQALVSGRVPFSARVSFDPDLTSRCWLADVGYDDGDRIYVFSYLVLVFQLYASVAFFYLLYCQHRSGRDPWWESLYRPLPLIVTALCFVVFAIPITGNLRH